MLPSTEEVLELAAEKKRREWGIVDQCIPDVMTMLMKLKDDGTIVNYQRVPDNQLPDDEAEFDPHTKIIRIRESTFDAANDLFRRDLHKRARFTIAHEIAHAICKHQRVRHRNVSNRPIEKIVAQTRIDEAEANRVAGALLIPRHLLDMASEPTASEISERFQVSLKAATIRLEELGRMHRRKHGIRRPLPKEVRDFLLEAKRRGRNVRILDDE